MRSTPSDYENEAKAQCAKNNISLGRWEIVRSLHCKACNISLNARDSMFGHLKGKKTTQGINPLLAKAPIFANHIFQPGSTPSSARLQILEGLFFLTGSEDLGWDPCVGAAAPPNTTLLLHGVEVHHPLAKTEEEAGGGRSAFNECGVKSGVRGWNWNKKKC